MAEVDNVIEIEIMGGEYEYKLDPGFVSQNIHLVGI